MLFTGFSPNIVDHEIVVHIIYGYGQGTQVTQQESSTSEPNPTRPWRYRCSFGSCHC